MSGAALETEHGNTRAGGERRVAPRRGDRDVVDPTIVTTHDEKWLIRDRARPLEHTVDESRIAGPGEGCRSRGQNDDKNGEVHHKVLHRAPPTSPARKGSARRDVAPSHPTASADRVSASSFLLASIVRRKKF